MIKNADKYNDFNVKILTEKFGSESLIDFHYMIKELEIKRYVSMTCLDIIHICPLGYKEYISPFKSKYFKALPLLKLLCSTLVGIAAGNATKILIAVIITKERDTILSSLLGCSILVFSSSITSFDITHIT
jgi:hypothetical protein